MHNEAHLALRRKPRYDAGRAFPGCFRFRDKHKDKARNVDDDNDDDGGDDDRTMTMAIAMAMTVPGPMTMTMTKLLSLFGECRSLCSLSCSDPSPPSLHYPLSGPFRRGHQLAAGSV